MRALLGVFARRDASLALQRRQVNDELPPELSAVEGHLTGRWREEEVQGGQGREARDEKEKKKEADEQSSPATNHPVL